METSFFSPHDLREYFLHKVLRADISSLENMAICSIADLLHICEDHKKGNLTIEQEDLNDNFACFCEEPEGPISTGAVHLSILDSERLKSSLFERDENGMIYNLWGEACKETISPRRSIRHLTLRISDDSSWWTEKVLSEMEDYHQTIDDNG